MHGYHRHAKKFGELAVYGSDASAIGDLMRADPSLGEALHPKLPIRAAQVVWAGHTPRPAGPPLGVAASNAIAITIQP